MNVYIWRRDDYSAMRGPCPEGFHIPTQNEWTSLETMMDDILLTTSNGRKENLFMPLAGRREALNSNISNQWTDGFYWSVSPQSNSWYAYSLQLSSSWPSIDSTYRFRSFAKSIRCFKDEPVVPNLDDWWDIVYQSPEATWAEPKWICHNASLWLLSISVDWQEHITLMDKNLWATTVYNSWSTLTQANMGNMYQWWNNYWFPSTWTVTTSSTQVDASNYWPWNYYSSSTFITVSSSWPYDWSSVTNDNLWWWVTWIQTIGHPIKNAYIGEWKTYTEVEYITIPNWWYIDTWYYPNSNTKCKAKFIMTWYNGGTFLGNGGSSEADQFRFFRSGSYTYLDYGSWDWYNRLSGSYITSTTAIYRTEFGNRYVRDLTDGTTKLVGGVVSFGEKSYTFRICSQWNYGTIYYVKIYDGENMVRDMVPAYRDIDGEIWMYDKINKVFYTNAWTWTFTKWPDVE